VVIVVPPSLRLFRLLQEPTWHHEQTDATELATGPPA